MTVRVHVTINHANMARFLTAPAGPIHRAVTRHTRNAFNTIQDAAPVDTGAGRAAMHSDVIVRGRSVVGRIYLPKHLIYQDQGTGEYAGNGPIRPKHGQYLVWEQRNRGPRTGRGRPLVFAKQVKGVKPKNFVVPALRRSVPWPVRTRK